MNIINKIVNRKSKIVNCFLVCILSFSCNFLDVVPDNIPTIDQAFLNRTEAQSYLYGLLGGMPDVGNYTRDPALAGSDELWLTETSYNVPDRTLRRILLGEQGPVFPYANYWASAQNGFDLFGGVPLWTIIADCNFFLENIHKPFDLYQMERDKWTGEALFVKAYCHFWLFRQYGPIPLIRENMSNNEENIMRYREPVDEVVEYIVSLLDQAISLLPFKSENETEEKGRPNKCIAAALKAQVLALAASPLFNCNPDYANYKDNRGRQLFPQDQSAVSDKWKRAADAAKEAIDMAHENLHRLFDARTDLPGIGTTLSEETILAMQVRGAATERWNSEIIWGNPRRGGHADLQVSCLPFFSSTHSGARVGIQSWSPSLRVVEQFYTKNGLPIEDDAEWTGRDLWAMRRATVDHKQYIRQDNQTIELHFDREARFYSSILFDQGTFFGNGVLTVDNSENAGALFAAQFKQGNLNEFSYNKGALSGYLCKKLVNHRTSAPASSTNWTNFPYAFPIIRLADLYLLYAEALNEWKDAPDEDVYEYIELVRKRSGLEKKLVDVWNDHAISGRKNLPLSQAGMREIIRRERLNELAFEGARYWDIRRWKLAEDYLNRPIYGMNVWGESDEEFYVKTELFKPTFEKKDYFSPIRTEVLVNNTNLLQSPYWSITE